MATWPTKSNVARNTSGQMIVAVVVVNEPKVLSKPLLFGGKTESEPKMLVEIAHCSSQLQPAL